MILIGFMYRLTHRCVKNTSSGYSAFKKQLIYINKWFGGPGFILQGLKLKEAYFISIAIQLKIKLHPSATVPFSLKKLIFIMVNFGVVKNNDVYASSWYHLFELRTVKDLSRTVSCSRDVNV